MRSPVQSIEKLQQGTSRSFSVPAPVHGWNTRDPLSAMDPLCAANLINFFPRAGELIIRGGAATWASGFATAVKTIFGYQTGLTQKLFGACASGIFDVTAGGAIGATVAALTDGYGKAISFSNSAGTDYLIFMNGVDSPWAYDGVTWAHPTVTGVTAANLRNPWTAKRRVWACEKYTPNAWYLPIDSFQGAAHKLPLGAVFKLGGNLVAGASWTLDAGDGPDDFTVFVSSEGEVAIYRGVDPDSATSWSLVGVYFLGRPIGQRCLFQMGGDLGLITEVGVFPLSKGLLSATINYKDTLTDSILPSMLDAAGQFKVNVGWEACLHLAQNALLVNIPQATALSQQMVMNTLTGAWTSFSNWNCWTMFSWQGLLYLGMNDGTVAKAWDGAILTDWGADVTATCQQAYSYMGTRGRHKKVVGCRPLMASEGPFELRLGLDSDFSSTIKTTTTIPRSTQTTNSTWNVSAWDVSSWSITVTRQKNWRAPSEKVGLAHSLILVVKTSDATVYWSGTDYLLADGGLM